MAKGTGTYDDPIICDGIFSKTINGVKKFFKIKTGSSVDTSQFIKKSGDVLTGSSFQRDTNTSSIFLAGGQGSMNGATLSLRGKDNGYLPGAFILECPNPQSNAQEDFNRLICQFGKTPTWKDKSIEIVNTKNSNYIRYESGLTFMWGNTNIPAGTKRQSINLPIPFKSNYVVCLSSTGNDLNQGTSLSYQISKKTLASFDIQHTGNYQTGWLYLAVGY